MAISDEDYAVFMENTEQVITARNTEDYLAENPEAEYPPPPDPTYAEWLPLAAAQFSEMLGTGPVVHAGVLTTGTTGGDLGKATITYPSMTTPVVVAIVLDTTQDNVYFQVALESVGATSAAVRVTQTAGTTLLGIPLLTVPSLASGATVHVMVYDAG